MKKINLFCFAVLVAAVLSCEPENNEGVGITGISVSPTEIEILVGESVTLTAEVLPEGTSAEIIWKSSDINVAEVNNDGEVSALAEGVAEISVTAEGFTAVCTVTVSKPVERSLSIDKEEIILVTGASDVISVEYSPETLVLQWSSSDNSVATVDENGKITAVAEGVAVVKVQAEELSAECSVTVLGDPKLGDYYYEDGTYSSDLIDGKNVIGVVFWVGDPTENDAALKKDFPWCTHGLVIAKTGEVLTTWQANYAGYNSTVSDWILDNAPEYESILTDTELNSNLNKIVGYNNTKAIEAFNANLDNADWPIEAAQQVVAYRKENPAPALSSGWYLPSIKELSLLCTGVYEGNIWEIYDTMNDNMKYINTRLEPVPDCEIIDEDGSYNSSSEGSWDTYYGMFMWNGYAGLYYKDVDYNLTRCVLAF